MKKQKIKIDNSYEDCDSLSTSLSSGSDDNTNNPDDKSFSSTVTSLNQLPALLNLNQLLPPASSCELNSVRNYSAISTTCDSRRYSLTPPEQKVTKPNKKSPSVEKQNKHLYKKDPPAILGDLITENSCNANDCDDHLTSKLGLQLNPSTSAGSSKPEQATINEELSFNGKIESINVENRKLLAHDTIMQRYTNEKSPDLFEDNDDDDDFLGKDVCKHRSDDDDDGHLSMTENVIEQERFVKIEEVLLKRLQMSLTGVLPPPSLTISQLNMPKMIQLYRDNDVKEKLETIQEEEKKSTEEVAVAATDETKNETEIGREDGNSSLLTPSLSMQDTIGMQWPEARTHVGHGIYYNRSKYSEKFESLSLKYVERYIGAETSSSFSFMQSPTSAKKRSMRLKSLGGKSPGNRLSHLARRRAIFSSENLANQASTSSTDPAKRQIILDPKKGAKHPRKAFTPKRRTPNRKKTPNSRQKKLAANLFSESTRETSRETSKRALFQSPPKAKPIIIPAVTPEVANRAQKSKRVLFSPEKFPRCSSFTINDEDRNLEKHKLRFNSMHCLTEITESSQNIMSGTSSSTQQPTLKRKRDASFETDYRTATSTSIGEKLTPNSLKFQKSQSFCGTHNNENHDTLNIPAGRHLIYRSTSEIIPNTSISQACLSEHHKKKLLWAVCHSLQLKQIGVSHVNFKQFAAVLARVTRKLYLEFEDNTGSTSEKMMKLTNRLVFHVIQGKSVEEIYDIESLNLTNLKNRLSDKNSQKL